MMNLIELIIWILLTVWVTGTITAFSIVLYQSRDFTQALESGIAWPLGLYWIILTIFKR